MSFYEINAIVGSILLFSVEYNPQTQHWLLLDRVVQQVVLQQPAAGSRANSEQGSERGSTSDTTKVSESI